MWVSWIECLLSGRKGLGDGERHSRNTCSEIEFDVNSIREIITNLQQGR